MSPTSHTRLRWAVTLLPLVIAAIIGWGTLRSDVNHLEAAVETKANRETVDAEYQAILRELQEIHIQLQRLR